jgi:hypothetical protein
VQDLTTHEPAWRTSSFSDGMQCVTVANLGGGRFGIKSSKDLADYSGDELRAFIEGVKAGEFDDMVGL